MPCRPDVNEVIDRRAREKGLAVAQNLRVIDVREKNAVVVDLFGKIAAGTGAGANRVFLFSPFRASNAKHNRLAELCQIFILGISRDHN